MTGALGGTTEVVKLIENRLKEIDKQLQPLTELQRERDKLKEALGALSGGEPRRSSPRRARKPGGRRSRSGKRAARGSNLAAITDFVSSNAGATAGEIAEATGISRGVVYSATSRLSSSGKLERVPKPDGQVGYRVA
jgi:Winged helix-turn-helix DNA-binding